MARSAEAVELWRRQIAVRKYALAPLKAALTREGRTQTWLVEQLRTQTGIAVKWSRLNSYFNGYARIPQQMLAAVCRILSTRENPVWESDITTRVTDTAVLIQPPRRQGERRKAASA